MSPFTGRWETRRDEPAGRGWTASTMWLLAVDADPDAVAGVWRSDAGWGLITGRVRAGTTDATLDARWLAPDGTHGTIRAVLDSTDPRAFRGRWVPSGLSGRPLVYDGRKVGDLQRAGRP